MIVLSIFLRLEEAGFKGESFISYILSDIKTSWKYYKDITKFFIYYSKWGNPCQQRRILRLEEEMKLSKKDVFGNTIPSVTAIVSPEFTRNNQSKTIIKNQNCAI